MAYLCPNCDTDIDIDPADFELADTIVCETCETVFEVVSEIPFKLALVNFDDEDEDFEDEEENE